MNTDKIILIVIGFFTLAIIGIILVTSIKAKVVFDAAKIVSDKSHQKGNENAKVTLVVFTDFECPYCAQFSLSQDQLLEKYNGDLRLVVRHFPLPNHTRSSFAAKASEAAAKQNKFFEYERELFLNQPNFSDQDLEKYAKNVGLDVEQFKKDYVSKEVADRVNADFEEGKKYNINSTPTFYLVVDNKVEQVKMLKENSLLEAINQYIKPKELASNTSSTTENGNLAPTPIDQKPNAINPIQNNGNDTKVNKILSTYMGTIDKNASDVLRKVVSKFINTNTNVDDTKVKINSVEKKDWSDSGIGCNKPGQMYAQVITPGYLIIIDNNSKLLNYHTDSNSNIVLCDK